MAGGAFVVEAQELVKRFGGTVAVAGIDIAVEGALRLAIGALLLRHGLGAESLAWLAAFLLAPASAVYYPVSVLPHWVQLWAAVLPSAHVFEGMRMVMFEHRFAVGHFVAAAALDAAYLVIGAVLFLDAFEAARRRGSLLQQGE